jgi:hypothetical protein
MRFQKWIVPFVIGSFLLASCGTTNNNSNTAGPSQPSMSLPEQLLIGTLKLEGTKLAVDKTQAATLLTLWEAYKELMSNNSTAKQETDAVISQIQSSITPDQFKAITNMKLTYKDIASTMTALGITFTPRKVNGTQVAPGQGFGGDFGGPPVGGSGGTITIGGGPGESTTGGNSRRSGSYGGNPTSGTSGGFQGGQGFNGQNLTQSQIATLQASRGNFSQTSGRIPTALLNALIDLLQKRSQP